MPLFRNVGQLVAAYNASAGLYEFLAGDFLFDANVIGSMYQDPFQETVVSVSSDPVSYMQDQAISTE